MAFEDETGGESVFQRVIVAGDLKDPAALAAVEVVMVWLAGHFVARRLSGEPDGCQPAIVEEELDRPINCGDSKAGLGSLRGDEYLVGAQWPVGLRENVANCSPLIGISLGHAPALRNWL